MQHTLPELEFANDALAPFLSAETLEYHHGKHHRGYVKKLNGLVASTDLEGISLTDLVRKADGAVFSNAAQHFNHSFYWRCLSPDGPQSPSGELLKAIERDFGSVQSLRDAFVSAALSQFGSGWCWIVADSRRELHIRTTANADCPVTKGETPLLTCDVWEHAYYIDYRNDRSKYVSAFWDRANWEFAALAFSKPEDIEREILGT